MGALVFLTFWLRFRRVYAVYVYYITFGGIGTSCLRDHMGIAFCVLVIVALTVTFWLLVVCVYVYYVTFSDIGAMDAVRLVFNVVRSCI